MNNQPDIWRVLVIGGYGSFGSQLVTRLAADHRLEILVAGRSSDQGSELVAKLGSANVRALIFDRDADAVEQVLMLAPRIVVDASGPFHAYGENRYRIAEAAIAAGAHYLDLADDRDFVTGIHALEERAAARQVFVISGASTSPALTGAIYRRLARHFASIDEVRGGIAPSARIRVGLNVLQAVTSYAGKVVPLRRNGRQEWATAICDTRSFSISPPGALPLRRRTFSLVDLPDLELAGDMEPAAANTWFGAAPIPAIYHWFFRVLARTVQLKFVSSLEPLAPLMHRVYSRFRFGEHRGGLFVEMTGTGTNGERAVHSFELAAMQDDGPKIPTLAAEIIVRACADGRIPPPGARPAHREIELAEFEKLFSELKICWGERDASKKLPLVARILGSRYTHLPAELQDLHNLKDESNWSGEASITRGSSIIARTVAAIVGFPPAGESVPVRVTLARSGDAESWQRDFDGHRFSSRITTTNRGRYANLFWERFGPVSIGMALVIDRGTLQLVPRSWRMLGIPMPERLLPSGRMVEYNENGRFNFHVEIKLPLIGHVVTYAGWLTRAS